MPLRDSPALLWPDQNVAKLLELLPIGEDVFLNQFNQGNLDGHLFGGQILGQALAAAYETIEGRFAHSLHGYFLRPGDVKRRVVFTVERLRNGRRFSTRRVTAAQGGKPIFAMICSFFTPQPGFAHQAPMPNLPPPEALPNLDTLYRTLPDLPAELAQLTGSYPIEIRPVSAAVLYGEAATPSLQFWVRVKSAPVTGLAQHQQVLAYLSDYWLIASALVTHRSPIRDSTIEIASLDHALWFHRPLRTDEWLLYVIDSPSALNGVNLARGQIFSREGSLVASVAQEGLQVPAA